MTSTGFLAHLYAMTGLHQPDPLTGRMGAQAALCLLQSAGCRSIMERKEFYGRHIWNSTQLCPQINIASVIRSMYYWNHSGSSHKFSAAAAAAKLAAQQAAYLFPSNATIPASPKDSNNNEIDCSAMYIPPESRLSTPMAHIISSLQCFPCRSTYTNYARLPDLQPLSTETTDLCQFAPRRYSDCYIIKRYSHIGSTILPSPCGSESFISTALSHSPGCQHTTCPHGMSNSLHGDRRESH